MKRKYCIKTERRREKCSVLLVFSKEGPCPFCRHGWPQRAKRKKEALADVASGETRGQTRNKKGHQDRKIPSCCNFPMGVPLTLLPLPPLLQYILSIYCIPGNARHSRQSQ